MVGVKPRLLEGGRNGGQVEVTGGRVVKGRHGEE